MTSDDRRGEARIEPRFEALGDAGDDFRPGADEPESNLRGKLLGALVACAAVAGFVGIAWYATTEGQKDPSTVVPMIRADNTPIKVLPDKPGGMKVPNQDKLIFMQIDPGQKRPKVERLLPPPEKPMAKPVPPKKPKAKPAKKTLPSGPLVPDSRALSSRTVPPKGAAGVESLLPPRKKPVAKPAPRPKTAKALPEVPAARPKTAKAPSKSVKPIPTVEKTVENAVKKAPKAVLANKAPVAPARGAFGVQLGSVKSMSRAQAEVRRLNSRHKSLLAGLTVKTVRADLGVRGIYYRLRAGPLGDRSAAAALCAQLKARHQGCIVIKP